MEYYMATTDIKSSPWRKGFSMENGKRRRNETILNTTVPLLPRELLRKHSYRPLSNLNTISIKILQYTNNSDRVKITMGNLHYTIPIKENSFFIFHLSGIFLLGLLTFRWSFCHLVGGDGRVGKVLMSLVICYGVEWIESWKVKKKQLGEFDCMHVSVLLLSFDVLMTEPNIMQRKLPRNPSPSNFGLHFLAHWLLYTWNGDTAIPSICKHCTNINRTNTQVTCTGSVTFKGTSSAVSISVSFEDKLPPRHYWRPKYQNVWPQKLSIEMNR